MRTRRGLAGSPADAILVEALAGVLVVGVMMAGLGHALREQSGWSIEHVVLGLVGHVGLGLAIALVAAWHLGATRFGLANHVTLLRAGLTCLAAGALGAGSGASSIGWPLVMLGTAALCLDGLDGWLARRLRLASSFGARFDTEVDALLLLTLALLVWQTGRVGLWVLAIGLLRYAFLLGRRLFPALRRSLPQSRRRKAVCVAQGVVLVICLLPPLPAAVSPWLAGLALFALAVSFAVDVAWLIRERAVEGQPRTELDQRPA